MSTEAKWKEAIGIFHLHWITSVNSPEGDIQDVWVHSSQITGVQMYVKPAEVLAQTHPKGGEPVCTRKAAATALVACIVLSTLNAAVLSEAPVCRFSPALNKEH